MQTINDIFTASAAVTGTNGGNGANGHRALVEAEIRRALRLGASLYVPANRNDLLQVAEGSKYPHLRSVIFCTEDSIHGTEVPGALEKLEQMLMRLHGKTSLQRFIRVRSPQVLRHCLEMSGIDQVAGFVLPKITARNLGAYLSLLPASHTFMATLETREAFDATAMTELRALLLTPGVFERLLTLRIGGNDLLNHLSIRRGAGGTIYATPLSQCIAQLITIFKPYHIQLTGPVFEYLKAGELLQAEAQQDMTHGLLPKAAIHPDQVAAIEAEYQVLEEDLSSAESILSPNAPAVFALHNFMCEPATHHQWAEQILARAEVFGVR